MRGIEEGGLYFATKEHVFRFIDLPSYDVSFEIHYLNKSYAHFTRLICEKACMICRLENGSALDYGK